MGMSGVWKKNIVLDEKVMKGDEKLGDHKLLQFIHMNFSIKIS